MTHSSPKADGNKSDIGSTSPSAKSPGHMVPVAVLRAERHAKQVAEEALEKALETAKQHLNLIAVQQAKIDALNRKVSTLERRFENPLSAALGLTDYPRLDAGLTSLSDLGKSIGRKPS